MFGQGIVWLRHSKSNLTWNSKSNWLSFTLVSKSNINIRFVQQSKYKDYLWLTSALTCIWGDTHFHLLGWGLSPPVYLLFDAVYWSRQPRAFRRHPCTDDLITHPYEISDDAYQLIRMTYVYTVALSYEWLTSLTAWQKYCFYLQWTAC